MPAAKRVMSPQYEKGASIPSGTPSRLVVLGVVERIFSLARYAFLIIDIHRIPVHNSVITHLLASVALVCTVVGWQRKQRFANRRERILHVI